MGTRQWERAPEAEEALRRAFALERERRLEESIEAYRDAIRVAPDDFEIRMRLAVILRAAGRDGEANAAFAEAHRLCQATG